MNVIGIPLPNGKFRPNKEMAGVADIHCIIKGLSIWLEVKTKKGKQTKSQQEFEKIVTSAEGYYFLVRSIEDVQIAIKTIK